MHEKPGVNSERFDFELPPHREVGRHVFVVPENVVFKHKLHPDGMVNDMEDYFQAYAVSDDGRSVIGNFLYSHLIDVVVPRDGLLIPSQDQIEELRSKKQLSKSQTIQDDCSVVTDVEAVKRARESYLDREVFIPRSHGWRSRATITEVYGNGFAKAVFSERGKDYEKQVDIQDIRAILRDED